MDNDNFGLTIFTTTLWVVGVSGLLLVIALFAF